MKTIIEIRHYSEDWTTHKDETHKYNGFVSVLHQINKLQIVDNGNNIATFPITDHDTVIVRNWE